MAYFYINHLPLCYPLIWPPTPPYQSVYHQHILSTPFYPPIYRTIGPTHPTIQPSIYAHTHTFMRTSTQTRTHTCIYCIYYKDPYIYCIPDRPSHVWKDLTGLGALLSSTVVMP